MIVRDAGPERLDIAPVVEFWERWFDRGRWPVEDIYYGLLSRFVRRVVTPDRDALEAVRGRSCLYLANHQVGVESLLFSILASGLLGVPTVTLAKAEHRHTWLGRLIAHCFSYPGVRDPEVITFFDRSDKASLPRVIGDLAAAMTGPGKSVMVHVEGTRSLSCREPVRLMSGAFIDMALKVNAPIVPVRFVGGLPAEPLKARLEFPVGMGTQDYWLGRPILPEELARMTYGDRKTLVIDAINGLGPANSEEEHNIPDLDLALQVEAHHDATGASLEHSALLATLEAHALRSEQTRYLLSPEPIPEQGLPAEEREWLRELHRRLWGSRS